VVVADCSAVVVVADCSAVVVKAAGSAVVVATAAGSLASASKCGASVSVGSGGKRFPASPAASVCNRPHSKLYHKLNCVQMCCCLLSCFSSK